MIQKEFSISEASDHLSAIVQDVEDGASVRLTRRGKPFAVLIPIHEYDRLNLKKSESDFWDDLMAFRQIIEEEGIEISDSDFKGLRDMSLGREADYQANN